MDFVLEGLYAQKKSAAARSAATWPAASRAAAPARREELAVDEEIRFPGGKKKYYN